MSAALPLALYALWLITGFAFVLWGLRIFKAYIAILGLSAGAALGASGAAFFAGDTQSVLIGGAIGALVGLFFAWPLQKLLVFSAAGTAGAAIAAAASLALGQGDYLIVAAIAGFILSSVLVLAFFDSIVICTMALHGALAVFHAVFVPPAVYFGDLRQVGARMLGLYAENLTALVATSAIFVAFAWWYQKRVLKRKDPADPRWPAAVTARRIAFRFAALILASWMITTALSLAEVWSVTSFDLAGMHALSWPLVTLFMLPFVRPRPPAPNGLAWRRPRFLTVALSAAVVPPIVTAALFTAFGAPWATLTRFYSGFISGEPTELIAKCVFSLAILPPLLWTAAPRMTVAAATPATPPDQPSEPEPAEVPAEPVAATVS